MSSALSRRFNQGESTGATFCGIAGVVPLKIDVRPRLWLQIVKNFVLPQVEKVPTKDKKLFEISIIRTLFRSERVLQPPTIQAWYIGLFVPDRLTCSLTTLNRPPMFTALIKLFGPPGSNLKDIKSSGSGNDDDTFVAMTAIDEEEQSAGYQAAYSRLAASESSEVDPLSYVSDPEKFLGEEMVRFSKSGGQAKLKELLGQVDPSVAGPVIQSLAGAGYSI